MRDLFAILFFVVCAAWFLCTNNAAALADE